jgi:hypothetical protein
MDFRHVESLGLHGSWETVRGLKVRCLGLDARMYLSDEGRHVSTISNISRR